MIGNAVAKRVLSKVDQDELVQLALDLSDINSISGCEREIGNFILNWFEQNGFHSIRQVVELDRCNAVGVLRGVGGGPSLTFNGHMDARIAVPSLEKSYVSDGLIYGNEIANMKAGLAAFLIGAKAINAAGVRLKGDLILACVVGELSVGGVGRFQETQDRGEGIGTRHLIANGIQSDYAVEADGSEYAIIRAQAGVADYKFTTEGVSRYTPFTSRPKNISESENAIVKMVRVVDAIENWAIEYEKRNVYDFPDGQVTPKVCISKIEAGMPPVVEGEWRIAFKTSEQPAICDLYVDVRLAPGVSPVKVKHELEELVNRLPFDCQVEMFRSQKGYEAKGADVDYLGSVVEKAYENIYEAKIPSGLKEPVISSMWTDTNLYWEAGITAVKWGPSDVGSYPDHKVAIIDKLFRAAKVYSLIALEVCGVAEK